MRKALSKSHRFEIFKRDKFTCQYCGSKAPEVILHVDHIEPVSKGGTNEFVNLVTSCFDCNSGKSDRKLSDNSVIEKQRRQLESLQERREQLELLFKWKKSLLKLEEETVEMIAEYINQKIKPYSLTNTSKEQIYSLRLKYDVDKILEAVDISASKYLEFTREGIFTEKSIENFFDKIGGILFHKNLSPLKQRISLVKSILKNNFDQYDPKVASIILSKYTSALQNDWNYEDDQIIDDIEDHLIPMIRESESWSECESLIKRWIQDIKSKEDSHTEALKP